MPRFTVEREERSYVDAHGITIHYYVWPVVSPTAVVQLEHGLGEYAARYEPLAQDLANAGYAVWADDHRGHGMTGIDQWKADPRKLGKLGPGGMRATVAGIRQFTTIVREANPQVPIALLGHSWGSLLAQMIANEAAGDYDALVLSGTAFRTLRHMASGDLSKRHAQPGGTGTEWLSRDPAVGAAFHADPMTFKAQAARLFGLADGLRMLGKPTKLAKDLPLLIQIGSEDTLGGRTSVELLADAYRKVGGLTDVTVEVYEGARHEVYNETNRDEVIGDLTRWLDAHLKYKPPRSRR